MQNTTFFPPKRIQFPTKVNHYPDILWLFSESLPGNGGGIAGPLMKKWCNTHVQI